MLRTGDWSLEHAGWRIVATGRKLDIVPLAESLTSHLFLGIAPKEPTELVTRLTQLVDRLERTL